MTISKQEAKRRAEERWGQWRLLLSGMITYRDLDHMDDDDIMEANAALDIHIEMQKKANSGK
ncbi:hypothetical protein [Paenibacillus sp. 32352]|uniref:hypothetical protein n=1 Tax=Paenibacillus sp. 32352 TaxID=1969111 RepID=UPI0009AD56D5|nr:hypothetical protein [Paenibacillus sp. 32352]